MKPFKEFVATLATPGGYVLVCLFVLLNGVALAVWKEDLGKFIVGESIGALFTIIRPNISTHEDTK